MWSTSCSPDVSSIRERGEETEGHRCLSLILNDGPAPHLRDDQKMAKVHLVAAGAYAAIPCFWTQGIQVLSGDVTAGRPTSRKSFLGWNSLLRR